jgi:hypothetical protein
MTLRDEIMRLHAEILSLRSEIERLKKIIREKIIRDTR